MAREDMRDIELRMRGVDLRQFNLSRPTSSVPPEPPLITTAKIRAHLDRHVYGQVLAKRRLVMPLWWNQERRVLIERGTPASSLPAKANVLLRGPTGTGKTLLAKTAAEFLNVPFYHTSAPSYCAAGYAGLRFEAMFEELLVAAKGDPVLAGRGIIFLDEVDKVRKRDFGSGHADVGGAAVQQGLLAFREGTLVTVGRHRIDTAAITFIAAGAFVGLGEKLTGDAARQVEAEELIKFGMIPEFVGRFAVRVGLSPLNAEDLERLLRENESSPLRRVKNLFALRGIELVVPEKEEKTLARTSIACPWLAITTRRAWSRAVTGSGPRARDFRSRPTVTDEQAHAVIHVTTKPGAIQCVSGMAGTGKSFMLGAAREVWEREGYTVLGAALAANAAEGLEAGSGFKSSTIHRRLFDIERGRLVLGEKSVVVLDAIDDNHPPAGLFSIPGFRIASHGSTSSSQWKP